MPNRFVEVLKDKRTYSMGIAVGIATWLLSWLVSFMKIADMFNWEIGGQQVISIRALSAGALNLPIGQTTVSMGTANALGVKAMAYLTAIPMVGGFMGSIFNATNMWALFILTVGSTILVIIGRLIYGLKFAPKGRPKWKLAVELLYGAIIGSLIIGGMGAVGFSAFMTLAIYYIIVAFAINQLARAKWYAKLIGH